MKDKDNIQDLIDIENSLTLEEKEAAFRLVESQGYPKGSSVPIFVWRDVYSKVLSDKKEPAAYEYCTDDYIETTLPTLGSLQSKLDEREQRIIKLERLLKTLDDCFAEHRKAIEGIIGREK